MITVYIFQSKEESYVNIINNLEGRPVSLCALFVILTIVLILSVGCAERTLKPSSVDQASEIEQVVGCIIRSEPICELGKAPNVTVTLTNKTNADMYLVGSLDGSDCKWRYPYCYFEMTGPDGNSPVQPFGRCGNMNSLREKDFVKVPPGGTFNPYQSIDDYGFFSAYQLNPSTFHTTGEYSIRFVYSTNSDTIAEWAGDGREKVAADKKLVAMFQQVPKLEVKSNEIRITVVEK